MKNIGKRRQAALDALQARAVRESVQAEGRMPTLANGNRIETISVDSPAYKEYLLKQQSKRQRRGKDHEQNQSGTRP